MPAKPRSFGKPPMQSRPKPRQKIARALGVETKYFDVAVGFNLPATTDWSGTEAISVDAPQIPQGDDIVQRNGRKIQLSRVQFRGTLQTTNQEVSGTGSTLPEPPVCRVILVRNLQPNAGSTSGEEVMGLNGGAAANSTVAVHMFQGVQSFGRYKLVDDILVPLYITAGVDASATNFACAKEKSFELHYRPKEPLILEYAGTATAPPNSNSFNILAQCQATGFIPSLQGVLRFYYTDV